MPVKVTIATFAGVLFVAVLIYLQRDRGAERRMRDSVALLRDTRRKAQGQRRPAPAGADASLAPPPVAPPSEPPPSEPSPPAQP
jgi:hypothetical protein